MKYRLGLDMGATSLGWAVYDIDTERLIDTGVRIFDDGREDKSKASLCVKRRQARSSRRLTNRRHMKMQELLRILTGLNLFPEIKEEKERLKCQNPYFLRKKALDEKLEPYELGRVFLHLAKRKGFLSNRKDDREEGGKLKKGYEDLQNAMKDANARTYGEFLYECRKKGEKIRISLFDNDGKFSGGLFPFREIYKEEFEKIWNAQKVFQPQILTNENKKLIKNAIFFQRPLKEPELGECEFEPGEKRIPQAHPLFQEFRIWQNIINLRFWSENDSTYKALEPEQNETLAQMLMNPVDLKPNQQGVVTYDKIKKALKLDKDGTFNYESGGSGSKDTEKGILVNTTQNAINNSQYFKSYWNSFSAEQKGKIINVITRPRTYIDMPETKISVEDEDKMILEYLCSEFQISREAAHEFLYDIPLEDGFGSLSEKAIKKILPCIKQGMPYADACKEAGYDQSGIKYDHLQKLPYYGKLLSGYCLGKKDNPQNDEERYGRINNATVHVALNQVRYLVNEVIDSYGQPYDIAVEYARDLPAGTKERSRMSKTRDSNEKENQRIRKELTDKLGIQNIMKEDILKYKIWERLAKNPKDRRCPFSGDPIGIKDLLNGQKFQIEHLIPFSRSFDDSIDNKVIASVAANRYKGNRTPYEAFGASPDGYNWKAIVKRAKNLSPAQQWRFSKDAMQQFKDNTGPIARSLNDTRYMTRLLQEYLLPIVREDGKKRVMSVVGPLTSKVREAWGLNTYKNKDDEEAYRAFHNHHAIDAFVVSALERSEIENVNRDIKTVYEQVGQKFRGELYKLRDKNTPKEEIKDLKKKIKDFKTERVNAIINQYVSLPRNVTVPEVLRKVAAINISHKASQKNIHEPNSTIGQLHEDSAYGLQRFSDDVSLKAVFKFMDKEIEKDITDYIPMFYSTEDKKAYYDAYKEWFKQCGKSKTMVAASEAEKELKRQQEKREKDAVLTLRGTAKKAFKWFVGGNNFCAEIYEINPNNKISGVPTNDRGKWCTEVVSNYNATVRHSRGEDIAYWHYKYPNARRVMTLRRNDMAMAEFTREQAFTTNFPKGLQEYVREKFNAAPEAEKISVLMRVKKMGNNGICFTPHDIAKKEADTKSFIASASALQRYNVHKVYVTPTGRIRHAE